MSAPSAIRLNPDSPAAREQITLAQFRENQAAYRALRDLFWNRRESRRLQLEQASGEQAIALRGRCTELTTILLEYFEEGKPEK